MDAFSKRQPSVATAAALDAVPPAPSAPAGVVAGRGAGVGAYQMNSAAPAKTAEVTAQTQYSQGGPAAKREPTSAFAGSISGRLMKTAIAHWNISSAGQLQRRNWDDTVTVVEPATGATFRAVAAQGIEVWAGGSQQVAGSANPILVHSSDAGATWKQVTGPWKGTLLRLRLESGGVVTVAAADGQWQTRDGGQSWTAVPGS
jgi:hypothetical protein